MLFTNPIGMHQFVRFHITLAHSSDLTLGKGCKPLFSLTLITALQQLQLFTLCYVILLQQQCAPMVKLLQTSVVVVRSFFCSLTCLTLASSPSKVWFEKVFRGARGLCMVHALQCVVGVRAWMPI